jgi:hypothetical protein
MPSCTIGLRMVTRLSHPALVGRRARVALKALTQIGDLKDAPHPNAAKLYLTWFLAREQQSRLGSFVAR